VIEAVLDASALIAFLRNEPGAGAAHQVEVSFEDEDGYTQGVRARRLENGAYNRAARHAVKCAESGWRQVVA
jgi:hypothetical protein